MTASKHIEDMNLREVLEYQRGVFQHAAGGAVDERIRNTLAVRIAELQDTGTQALVAATG